MTLASDAPVRAAGTRTRSGNAMPRTRSAILDAAERCVAAVGVRRSTMGDVATEARVAKATLYNHFRTKDDLLEALVLARIELLASECAGLAGDGLARALRQAARALGTNAAVRRVAAEEPAVLAALVTARAGRAGAAAREGVRVVLAAAGSHADPVTVEVVLRAVVGHLLWAADESELAAFAAVLAAGLAAPPVVVPAAPAPPAGTATGGVGWPT